MDLSPVYTPRGYLKIQTWCSNVLRQAQDERFCAVRGELVEPRRPAAGARRRLLQSRGFTLVESIVALALISVAVPALITTVAATTRVTDNAHDRSILFELAQSQMEEIQRQAYQENAANYSVISAPEGYSIAVAATIAQTYTYPAPKSTNTLDTVQLATTTVTGDRGDLSLQAYKVRR
jgi:prepilin-type N-terminal cleavage/methylation domain-containing protein